MHKIKHEDRNISWYRKWDKHLAKRARIRKAHLAMVSSFNPVPIFQAAEVKESWLQKLLRRIQQMFNPSYATQT